MVHPGNPYNLACGRYMAWCQRRPDNFPRGDGRHAELWRSDNRRSFLRNGSSGLAPETRKEVMPCEGGLIDEPIPSPHYWHRPVGCAYRLKKITQKR